MDLTAHVLLTENKNCPIIHFKTDQQALLPNATK